MNRKTFASRRSWPEACAAVLLLLCSAIALAQETPPAQSAPAPQPVPGAPNLLRSEGVDAGSGIHYHRLSLSPASSSAQLPPRFTLECRDKGGKHDLLWFASFGGVPDPGFEPPFHRTDDQLFPPRYPNVKLEMTFEGYMKSKPFTRAWISLPSGEFLLCNSGMSCPNMDNAKFFMSFLTVLPGLRIGGEGLKDGGNPTEVFFQTQPLLDEMKKSPVCAF
jgi:hypothetical protein